MNFSKKQAITYFPEISPLSVASKGCAPACVLSSALTWLAGHVRTWAVGK